MVLTASTNVYRELGLGLSMSLAMMVELGDAGTSAGRQVEVPVHYRGHHLGTDFRADIIVEGSLLLELKSDEQFTEVHLAQVITYLKLLRFKHSFLLKFNKRLMKDGIKRVSI